MYGDHHQQPQKDCRYDEPDPFLVVREPCMRMIGPVHGQPTFHAAPNPTPYHILRFDDGAPRPWQRAILPSSGQSEPLCGLARWGDPGFEHRLEALPIPANSERLALAGAFVHYFFFAALAAGQAATHAPVCEALLRICCGPPLAGLLSRLHFSTHAGSF